MKGYADDVPTHFTQGLKWPEGWDRTPEHRRRQGLFREQDCNGYGVAASQISIVTAVERVQESLRLLGADDIRITANFRVRYDEIVETGREPNDPGASVYWGEQRCMAIDLYTRIADNLAAISATLNALRAIERHGGAVILNRVFTGLVALPRPATWFEILGVSEEASVAEIDQAYRKLAKKHHPDNGGSHEQMAQINVAREEGRRAASCAAY